MHSGDVKIISFNVNGVLNPIKRSKILSKLKKEKAQVAFLQETHMSQSEHVTWALNRCFTHRTNLHIKEELHC